MSKCPAFSKALQNKAFSYNSKKLLYNLRNVGMKQQFLHTLKRGQTEGTIRDDIAAEELADFLVNGYSTCIPENAGGVGC